MQARNPQYQPYKTAIRDWQLVEDEQSKYFCYELPGILSVLSAHDRKECHRLLKAVINMYINIRLQRQGVTNHWSRERKLLINYLKKEHWQWQVELLDVAKAYNKFENRDHHNAILLISGSIVRFDSQIIQVNRSI